MEDKDAKIPIVLLNKQRIERIIPFVKRHETQLLEFWELLMKLKKESKETLTKTELNRQLEEVSEIISNKVSYDMRI